MYSFCTCCNTLESSMLASVYMPVDVCGGQTDEDFEFVCGYSNALIVVT